jgi:hypothetical protein
VNVVQHMDQVINIQADDDATMSTRDTREVSEQRGDAISDFSLLNYHNEETEDQHSHNQVHLRKVAASITNVAYQFSTCSRNEETLSLYREAVDIRRQLAS